MRAGYGWRATLRAKVDCSNHSVPQAMLAGFALAIPAVAGLCTFVRERAARARSDRRLNPT